MRYPFPGEPDGMELEDFVDNLQKQYGIDVLWACFEKTGGKIESFG
jgi:hypothetical protein